MHPKHTRGKGSCNACDGSGFACAACEQSTDICDCEDEDATIPCPYCGGDGLDEADKEKEL